MSQRFIAIEGPIGVGKTSLARRLADSLGADVLLEQPQDNPFLERFYREPKAAALATQLAFLLQREQQLRDLRQGDLFQSALVADYLIDKDCLFAALTLDAEEFKLYEQIYAHLTLDIRPPDLVVYLQAPVEVLLARIQRRGRRAERTISAPYLKALNEAYASLFMDYHQSPVLIVNAARINPLASAEDYAVLFERIEQTRHGRHYFNPEPALT